MRLAPDRDLITRPMSVWLKVAALLTKHGDSSLAAAIWQAMNSQRLGENASFSLTVDEQLRVDAVRQDWLGEQDPD